MNWDFPGFPAISLRETIRTRIFDAIDRYFTEHQDLLKAAPVAISTSVPASEVFVTAPSLLAVDKPIPERLRRLIRKFDPVERDHRNRSLGRAGEEFVLDLEHRRLTDADRSDLARKIRWVAAEEGDGAGFDIFSFRTDRAGAPVGG